LRGVWASAAAESASPKPATIAIFFSIMFAPTVQEYSDQRFDHSQRIGCKGGRPEFVKPGLQSGIAYVCDDDVAAALRDGRLHTNAGERGRPNFPALSLLRQSAAAARIHGTQRSTLPQIPAQEGKLSAAGSSRGRRLLPKLAPTDDISESQFGGATRISRIAR
jgi:hypothetical protein